MRHKQMKNADLARACGVSPAAVGQWLSNDTKAPKAENIFRIAKATGVSAEWLTTGKGAMVPGTNDNRAANSIESNVTQAPPMKGYVPLISWVAAGGWTEVGLVETDLESAEWMPCPPGASAETFALRVVGESMTPRYQPGTVIFVDPAVQPENGDDVVCQLTDSCEATFKRLVLEPGSPKMLMALNEAWPQRFLEINGNCKLVGTVIADMNLRRR